MYFKLIAVLGIVIFSSLATAQSLDELRNREIQFLESGDATREIIAEDLLALTEVGFDSVDVEVLIRGTMYPTIISMLFQEHDGEVTYGTLADKIVEIKGISFYPKMKHLHFVSKELFQRPADYKNWEQDKELIKEFGLDEENFLDLKKYVREHSDPKLNYKELLSSYQLEREEKERKVRSESVKELDDQLSNSKAIHERSLLFQSEMEEKPILMYFTAYASVNCRKIEEGVLFKGEIAEYLLDNFIIVPLYVDDRNELPKEEQEKVFIDDREKQIVTIGDKNMYYQTQRFGVTQQPYFVILNFKNEVKAVADYYTHSPATFLTFLKGWKDDEHD